MNRIVGITLIIFCLCFSTTFAATPDEQSAEKWFNQGYQYNLANEYQKAIDAYTKAIEINPQDADANYNRGIAHFLLNQYDQAIKNSTKVIQTNPKEAIMYFCIGRSYDELKQKEKAIENYQLFLKYADPSSMAMQIEVAKKQISVLSNENKW